MNLVELGFINAVDEKPGGLIRTPPFVVALGGRSPLKFAVLI
jgi:hypothetical protein